MALFLPNLKKNGFLDSLHMCICNVGSRKISSENDYGSQVWQLFAPNLVIYGFDADADACEVANQDLQARQVDWQEIHLPYAIAQSVGESPLYVTHNPMCSSLYPPNEPFLKRFSGLLDLAGLDFSIELDTTTLDTLLANQTIGLIDFLQIDVQGADLQVLQGALNLLEQSVLAIQIEVEFSPLYVNQPLFGEVDQFLRGLGFALFDLAPSYMQRSPIASNVHPGQLLWADAFYLRDPLQATSSGFYTQPAEILKLACIADALGFIDYSIEILEYLTIHYGQQPQYNLADTITESLSQVPGVTEMGIETIPTIQNLQAFLTKQIPTSP